MSELPETLREIEAAIGAAGHYVVPSDNLRPRILEAARAQAGQRLGQWRIVQLSVALLLCGVLSIPIGQRVEAWRRETYSPTAGELELRAQQIATQPNIGPHWALYEAFMQVRMPAKQPAMTHE